MQLFYLKLMESELSSLHTPHKSSCAVRQNNRPLQRSRTPTGPKRYANSAPLKHSFKVCIYIKYYKNILSKYVYFAVCENYLFEIKHFRCPYSGKGMGSKRLGDESKV